MTEKQTSVLASLEARFGNLICKTHSFCGDDTAVVDRKAMHDVAQFLRDDPAMGFNFLMDLTAVDYPQDEQRFEVVYHFYSLEHNHRVRIKARVAESDPTIASLTDLWPGANWYEREVWDMFGVKFEGHPNLKRILMYEEFIGHPLRKDYPITKRQPLVPTRPDAPSPASLS